MKKIILFVSAFALLLTACSSDDSEPAPATPSGTLLTKIIETYTDGTVEIVDFQYNGDKIATIVSDFGDKSVFTYTGDLITKEEYFVDDIIEETIIYDYDANQRLIKSTLTTGSTIEIDDFTYNSNNTVTFITTSAGNTIAIGTIYFNGDQPYKKELTENPGTTSEYSSVEETTFDSKVNPFVNVKGLDKIEIATPSYSLGYGGIFNNSLELKRDGNIIESYAYTYNANNMPATEVYDASQVSPNYDSTSQYIYN